MTEQELAAQRAKFNTYSYRKAIHQAEVARRNAEAVLQAEGLTDAQIKQILD